MAWTVLFAVEFAPEVALLPDEVRDRLYERVEALHIIGPTLGRPTVDTLSGSSYTNMKELRFDAGDGVWRVAFAFDPKQNAILLVAGDRSGVSQGRFYASLIAKADSRYAAHLERSKKKVKGTG